MTKSLGIGFFIVLFLSACAPQYTVKSLYSLPTSNQSKTCVQACSSQRAVCTNQCNLQYNKCVIKAEKLGKESFLDLNQEYQHQFSIYQSMMVEYDIEMELWSSTEHDLKDELEYFKHECAHAKKFAYVCKKAHDVNVRLFRLQKAEPPIPLPPSKPVLSSQVNHAISACGRSCSCAPEYDSCFVSCGGELRYEKYCIKNCD